MQTVEIVLEKLFPWQQDVFNEITTDTDSRQFCIKAKRQVGKSILAISVLFYFAFKNAYSIGVMVEPVLHQSRRVYKQMINALGGEKSKLIKHANAQLLEIEFVNGSQVLLRSAEQGEALRGLTVKNSVCVIDEGAYIEDDIFFTLDPITDATKSSTLIISTPLFCSGEFYERYNRGLTDNPFVKSFDWATYDTSALLPPEKLEYYRQTMSALKFQSEYLGQFIKEGSYLFGDITKCVTGYSTKPAVYAGIDWGAGGTDSTVVIFMDEDRRVTGIKRWTDVDPVDLVEALAERINAHPTLTQVQVEKNSIGEVYLSMLKRKVKNGLLKAFVTTNDSKRRIIEELIKAFQTQDVEIPNDAELIKQIQHYGMEKTPSGKVTYNGQDGVHDDMVLSLAICLDLYKNKNKKFSIGFA